MTGRPTRVLRILIPTTAAITAAVGVGVATGTIPDSGGVVHGCYQNHRGTLRVIDTRQGATCANSETALTWNQRGPAGPPGPPGPSRAYSTSAPSIPLTCGPTGKNCSGTVTLSALPPGGYAVSGKAVADMPAGSQGFDHVTCTLSADTDTDTSIGSVGEEENSGVDLPATTLSTQLTHQFTSSGSVVLRCTNFEGAEVTNVKLTAIKLDSVTNQPPS
jgi:hypothetical protein